MESQKHVINNIKVLFGRGYDESLKPSNVDVRYGSC